jgi:hypothetical protein
MEACTRALSNTPDSPAPDSSVFPSSTSLQFPSSPGGHHISGSYLHPFPGPPPPGGLPLLITIFQVHFLALRHEPVLLALCVRANTPSCHPITSKLSFIITPPGAPSVPMYIKSKEQANTITAPVILPVGLKSATKVLKPGGLKHINTT